MHLKKILMTLAAVMFVAMNVSIAAAEDAVSPPANPDAPAAASEAGDKPEAGPPLSAPTPPAAVQPPATAQPPTAAQPPGTPEPTPSVTIIGAKEAHAVLGRDVRSANGDDMGRIVDIIVDKGGTVRAAVIDFGGFLGVGSRRIVVDWTALHFGDVNNKGDSITLELTREQVKAAPEYAEDKPIVVLGAAGKLRPLGFEP